MVGTEIQHVKRIGGFTLIEVMIASVMGAFIAMVAVAALRTVTSAKEMVSRNTTVSDEVRFALDMVRTDMVNIFRDADVRKMKFVGTAEEADFGFVKSLTMRIVEMTKARAGEPEGDVYEVQYFLQKNEESSIFMRRLCPVVGIEEDVETQGGMLTAIAENIIQFDVQYYYEGQWWQDWPEDQGALPTLVEVTLVGAGTDAKDKSDVVVKSFMAGFVRLGEENDEDFDNVEQSSSG